jgi:hypothetical protein
MSRVRIAGLVGLADDVRRELAVPLTAGQIERVRAEVRKALTTVDSILAKYSATPTDLPPPSRRAYQFLAGIDFGQVYSGEAACTPRAVAAPGAQLRYTVTSDETRAYHAISCGQSPAGIRQMCEPKVGGPLQGPEVGGPVQRTRSWQLT